VHTTSVSINVHIRVVQERPKIATAGCRVSPMRHFSKKEEGGAQHSYIISKRKMKILLTSSIQHPRKTSRDGTSLGDETLGMRGIGGTTRTSSGASSNKVKTEMCTSIVRGNSCAFGIKCKYAHEIDELSLRTLVERDEAGLIDLMTFRTRPCLDHVMTGSW
jgi:hypothetical protein